MYVALLRGINVGGHKKVPMAELRELAGELGLDGARTLLQSGNLVFRGPKQPADTLERRLAKATAERFGFPVEFIVRTGGEWDALIDANPFVPEATRDPAHLHAMCLRATPTAAQVTALQAGIVGPEVVRAVGRELYLVYPAGAGTSKLTNAVIERDSAPAARRATGTRC